MTDRFCGAKGQVRRVSSVSARAISGFSLLELLVAFSIMALSLGVLYRAIGSNLSATDRLQRYQGAVVLAQSLLEVRDSVPKGGWSEQGSSAGYRWAVKSQPYNTAFSGPRVPSLYEVSITVEWSESGNAVRSLAVSTLRPERIQPVGPAL